MKPQHKLLLAAILALVLATLILMTLAQVARAPMGSSLVIGAVAGAIDPAPIAKPFTDIEGHPYAWAIEEIRLAGLTAGCSTDPSMFCPDRPLTRAEAAVFLARILELSR